MTVSTPLSNYWTHRQIVSEAMVLTNTIDNENIQLSNVRNHMNSGISYLANLLNIASMPHYGIWMNGTYETGLHPSGLEWVNLATALPAGPNVGAVPARIVTEIRRINWISPAAPILAGQLYPWNGNLTKLDVGQLTQLNNTQNVQWQSSIAWTHHGNEVLLFIGRNISTVNRAVVPGVGAQAYTVASTFNVFTAWAYRKPMLDNLVDPDLTPANQNYATPVDLPDEYVDLLIKIVQKKIMEQLREQVPAQLEQEINAGVQAISQQLIGELQFEQADREKRKYGNQQKTMGGGQ